MTNRPALPRRVFLDGSHSCTTGRTTGIERVVRNIIGECERWCVEDGVPMPRLVTHSQGRFYLVENALRKRFCHLAALESDIQAHLPKWYLYLSSKVCYVTKSARLKKWLLPEAGHLGLFKTLHNLYDAGVHRSLPFVANCVQPSDEDLFLLPDAYWTRRAVWKAAEHARQKGATIVTVLYDLIPLTHPQFVGTRRQEGFRRYLHRAIENSDMLVAISQTVQNEVSDYIRENRDQFSSTPSEIRNFTLGAELNLVQGDVREQIRKVFKASPAAKEYKSPYLMVATFDPRKNHHYLLDAFDQLWQKNVDVKLCLVGRVGALCEDVVQRINQHPALNDRLFAFYDLRDAELQFCYQHCRGAIFPSIVEGFGLPIVESLWFGKKTFASDTPIHREVGKSDCVYFDLKNPCSLADMVEIWDPRLTQSCQVSHARRPVSWEESSRQLIDCCLDAYFKKSNPLQIQKAAA